MPPDDTLRVRLAPAISAIDPASWDACANPAPESIREVADSDSQDETYNPFISFAFLSALEDAGCVCGATGWAPAHLVAEDAQGRIAGCAPAYLKNHSQGEYVFDHGWADAYERAGGSYYPKLQVSVPFTPVTGRRLLARPGDTAGRAADALGAALLTAMRRLEASSVHATFLTAGEQDRLGALGWLARLDTQYHWLNEGYGSFEDFLGALASRKRKLIRRERRDALAEGITIHRITGAELREEHWDAFHAFYQDTGSRKWGRPYLNRTFFSLLGERMAGRILLVMARRDGRWIAGALNLIGDTALYGRNWGAVEDHPFLHFEACYYQAMDFAIERGLARVEAGAQGEHKLLRGYRPSITRSAHAFADPALARAVDDFLKRERRATEAEARMLAEHLPFRQEGRDG